MINKQIARAKVNLSLHVVGQRYDGYHLLDSIVGFADHGDVLKFEKADVTTLTINGPFADSLTGEVDNLVLKAARCFSGEKGAAIYLEKNLPVASGIGGGSADAAAALRGLADLWEEPMPSLAMQLKLGADVPVCLARGIARMQGIGEKIIPLLGIAAKPIILINPGVSLSTPKIFNALAIKENAPIERQTKDAWNWILSQRNDLEGPAVLAEPVIADVLDAIIKTGAILARMSGSGATCFGVFDSECLAAKAAEVIATKNPDWWIQTTRLTT